MTAMRYLNPSEFLAIFFFLHVATRAVRCLADDLLQLAHPFVT
jgi:hypothetical protein